MFTKVPFFFWKQIREVFIYFLTLVCGEWPPNSAYLPREILNPTYFQLFQPQPYYLAPGTVPVISSLESQEDREARHPEDGSWGWLAVCPIYWRCETILSVAPRCSFWLLLCIRLLPLSSLHLSCTFLFASRPPQSWFLILVKAPLLPPFAGLIFGSCHLSLHTWSPISPGRAPIAVVTRLSNIVQPCLSHLPGPVLLRVVSFLAFTQPLAVLLFSSSAWSVPAWPASWTSVLSWPCFIHSYTQQLGSMLCSSSRPQIPFQLTPCLVAFPFQPGSNLEV